MERAYPERPLVGVGAVILKGEEVLLVKRGRMPGKGDWSLPGGLVELGETVSEALHRELWEELSVEVELIGLLGVYDRIVRDVDNRIHYHYVIVDYCARILSGEPRAGSDAAKAQWVNIAEMDSMGIDPKIGEAILKASNLFIKVAADD